MKNFQTQKNYSKRTGGYNAALAVPGHGLYAALVLVLATQIGLVLAMLLVIVPYMYLSAKIYNRQQRSDYQLQLQLQIAEQKRQDRRAYKPKLSLTPQLRAKKPSVSFAVQYYATKATI